MSEGFDNCCYTPIWFTHKQYQSRGLTAQPLRYADTTTDTTITLAFPKSITSRNATGTLGLLQRHFLCAGCPSCHSVVWVESISKHTVSREAKGQDGGHLVSDKLLLYALSSL